MSLISRTAQSCWYADSRAALSAALLSAPLAALVNPLAGSAGSALPVVHAQRWVRQWGKYVHGSDQCMLATVKYTSCTYTRWQRRDELVNMTSIHPRAGVIKSASRNNASFDGAMSRQCHLAS